MDRPAALPMYDVDRAAVGAWWARIAAGLRDQGMVDVPSDVAWPTDLDAHWRHPRLLLSQTCGHPLTHALHGAVQVVGAFRYGAPGCSGIGYRSDLMARRDDPGRSVDDFRGRTLAFNDRHSHSGFHSLRSMIADDDFFGHAVASGSHRASLAMLRDGRADIAAIDCVTLAGLRRDMPHLIEGLHAIGHTALAPGLPLITSNATTAADLGRLRSALRGAVDDPALAAVRETLFIVGFEAVDAATWAGMRCSAP